MNHPPPEVRHRIVYLSHGGETYYQQTRYSALTLLDLLLAQRREDICIYVYTDRPEAFPQHPLIVCKSLSPEELQRFRGPHDYVHRIKLEVLRRAEREIGLPLVYVDSDTRWVSIPDEAFGSLHEPAVARPPVYMHAYEEPISANSAVAYYRLLSARRESLKNWSVDNESHWQVWNTGTIGVSPASQGLFDTALELNDELYPHSTVKPFIEQLAVSLLVVSRCEIKPFETYLVHFWKYGNEFPELVRRFFRAVPGSAGVHELAKACAQLDVSTEALEAVKRDPEFRRAQRRAKRSKSLRKRKVALKALWERWFG